MKQNDVVKLTNITQKYKSLNLYKNVSGIILKVLPNDKLLVLFVNEKNIGDYAVVEVVNQDLEKQDYSLPSDFLKNLEDSNKISSETFYKKESFEIHNLSEYDMVELLVEEEKYSSLGIHKGDTGIIASNKIIQNSVLVAFSGVDNDNNFFGDCISVKIKDLKKIK